MPAWVEHTFVLPWDVVWYWGCVPEPEQHAARQLAAANATLFPYAIAALVDVEFLAASPLWWERRRDTWLGNWQVEESEIEIDDITVRVYSTSAAWADDLWACMSAGGCPAGDSDCPTCPPYSFGGA